MLALSKLSAWCTLCSLIKAAVLFDFPLVTKKKSPTTTTNQDANQPHSFHANAHCQLVQMPPLKQPVRLHFASLVLMSSCAPVRRPLRAVWRQRTTQWITSRRSAPWCRRWCVTTTDSEPSRTLASRGTLPATEVAKTRLGGSGRWIRVNRQPGSVSSSVLHPDGNWLRLKSNKCILTLRCKAARDI